ncbi:uncharacterized protein LOC118436945 [Folsomia candida]|uniref:MARVEL domain-containing protein n=1 Tax=Folsomia candida TaxID=158441 RepID=A0A226DUA6_FOLCA|nr:uncharacterized protein LOC118436945 [Folsomia candida]XP_035711554.1 uncharacterized protein LOC118436945 [Folsomia candida]OXA48799.1 hypothetical protein Fcan01_16802 [Folsomia candida]
MSKFKELLSQRVVQIRILSIVFGILALSLSHNHLPISEEEAFFFCSALCLSISVILLVLTCSMGLKDSETIQKVDKLYHIAAGICLITTASFFLVSTARFKQAWKISYTNDGFVYELNYERRVSAGAFGILYAITCGIIEFFLWRQE